VTGAPQLDLLARDEVIALHAFFAAWFRDDGEPVPDFTACEAAFATNFRMIAPDGKSHDREQTLRRIHESRGALGSSFRIEVLDIETAWASEDAVLLEYVEQQYRARGSTRRRSTGLFIRCPSAPRGVLWQHLQETWLDSAHRAAA
jgi:hypothetical protein